MRGVDFKCLVFKCYNWIFMLMLALNIGILAINRSYNPLHIWLMVESTIVFIFRLLMFVDNWLAAGLSLDFGTQQRDSRFCGRVVVLSILALLLYPFLCVWSVVGAIWVLNCLKDDFDKWTCIIWLVTSYLGLFWIAWVCVEKWLIRRRAQLLRAQQGIPNLEFGILVDMVRVPDWAFEAAEQEMRSMGQDAATYQPRLCLNPAQRQAAIQELPKLRLKSVPIDCTECCICLEEFYVGNEVRRLPCAHNFHVECIDHWLGLSVKCPQCRCSVFQDLDHSALSNLQSSDEGQEFSNSETTRTESRYPSSQIYRLRLQGILYTVRLENANPRLETAGTAQETADENGGGSSVLTSAEPTN